VKRQGAQVWVCRILGLCGMGILWGYPQDFLWVWDGYGDRNSVPTAALHLIQFPSGISIGSAVFARLTTHADTQTVAPLVGGAY